MKGKKRKVLIPSFDYLSCGEPSQVKGNQARSENFESEKWRAIRVNVVGVLAWVACMACLRGWRGWCASVDGVGGMLFLLLLLLLKYYPEKKMLNLYF